MAQDNPSVSYWRSQGSVVRSAAGGRDARNLRSTGLRSFVFSALLATVALCVWPVAARAELTGMSEDEHVATKEISGQVTYAGKRAISVEYDSQGKESYEMLIPINDNTKVEHLKSLAELKRGDQVQVQYQQTYREIEDGPPVILKTVALKVALLKSAIPEGTMRSTSQVTSK